MASDRLTAVSVPYEGWREPPQGSANLQRRLEDRAPERPGGDGRLPSGEASTWSTLS